MKSTKPNTSVEGSNSSTNIVAQLCYDSASVAVGQPLRSISIARAEGIALSE